MQLNQAFDSNQQKVTKSYVWFDYWYNDFDRINCNTIHSFHLFSLSKHYNGINKVILLAAFSKKFKRLHINFNTNVNSVSHSIENCDQLFQLFLTGFGIKMWKLMPIYSLALHWLLRSVQLTVKMTVLEWFLLNVGSFTVWNVLNRTPGVYFNLRLLYQNNILNKYKVNEFICCFSIVTSQLEILEFSTVSQSKRLGRKPVSTYFIETTKMLTNIYKTFFTIISTYFIQKFVRQIFITKSIFIRRVK